MGPKTDTLKAQIQGTGAFWVNLWNDSEGPTSRAVDKTAAAHPTWGGLLFVMMIEEKLSIAQEYK